MSTVHTRRKWIHSGKPFTVEGVVVASNEPASVVSRPLGFVINISDRLVRTVDVRMAKGTLTDDVLCVSLSQDEKGEENAAVSENGR